MNSIITDRLLLRPLQLSDAKFFVKHLPEIDQFLSLIAPKSIQEAEDLIRGYLIQESDKKAVRFVIENKNTGDFIGVVGVYSLDTDGPERHCWIRKDFQRQGYAFEAISGFMKWANKYLDYSVMYSSFDIGNEAMKKLNEKLGGAKGNDEPEPVLQKSGKVLNILWYSYHKPN